MATLGRASGFFGPYHYIPDVVEALATLGTADGTAYGGQWMLPCAEAGSLRDLVHRLEAATGRTLTVGELPRLAVKAVGLFMPLMRELNEMLYQWEEPFIVDDSRFRARFGVQPTAPDAAARATAEWALSVYPHA